jgi:hypothetical protein
MLTPSELELLRQDLQSALSVLGQDEIDDAHQLLRQFGFRPSEFEILQRCEQSPAYPSALVGDAIVIRKSNRILRTYKAGNESSWLQELEADLKTWAFGPR